jgi:putative ABC transport system permease protein
MPLRIGDIEIEWTIVGVRRSFQPPIIAPLVYVDETELAQSIGHFDHADTIRIDTTADDAATHNSVLAEAESRLGAAGIEIRSTRTGAEDRRIFTERFNILTVILLVLAFLLGTVGGLGLMGTMSINVLERRREIGVMRAIGASNRSVMAIVVVEGVAIGLLSWVGALLVAQVLSRFMAYAVGMSFVKLPLSYMFDWRAPLMWIGIVVVIASLSSMLPAYSAVRMSVRETLAYE